MGKTATYLLNFDRFSEVRTRQKHTRCETKIEGWKDSGIFRTIESNNERKFSRCFYGFLSLSCQKKCRVLWHQRNQWICQGQRKKEQRYKFGFERVIRSFSNINVYICYSNVLTIDICFHFITISFQMKTIILILTAEAVSYHVIITFPFNRTWATSMLKYPVQIQNSYICNLCILDIHLQ